MNYIPHNEVKDFTSAQLQEIYSEVESSDVVGIESFTDDFLAHLETDPIHTGIQLPWPETSDLVRLRTREVSVWAGINGHQKSTVLSQCLVWASSKVKVGLMSFEMPVKDTAKMMCQQSCGIDKPSREYGERFATWMKDRFYWYRVLGGVEPIQALGAIKAMAKRGCKIIAIDNLQFTGVTEDISRERLFFNQLMGMAEALDVHIAIVHHVRKPDKGGDEYIPTRFDVRGGGTIVDQAHVLFIVWHNKLRKKALAKQELHAPLSDREKKEIEAGHDLRLIVAKQRNAEFEGTIGLFQSAGRSFTKSRNGRRLTLEGI